jgi:tRNA nucleotidyltransferase/poly(A) polymerase
MNIFEEDFVTPINLEDFERVFTPEIKEVINAIRKYGFDLRVVGGAVRDFLLGKPPRDIDFATDADPAELILIFDLEGIQYDAKGIVHGTVKAVFGDDKIDVTSIAYKINVDDTMQIVRGQGWEEDAEGRDLTINSLSLDMDGNIHDYVKGIDDLKNSVIRLNPSQYEKIKKSPEIVLRWFKALAIFDNPKWPKEDFELIKQYIPSLASMKDTSKIEKTLGGLLQHENGEKVIKLMCSLHVNQFIDLNCK